MKKTTESTKDQTPKATTERKPAKSERTAQIAKGDPDGETTDRLPTTLSELKETKGGFVAHLFLTGKDRNTIAKELAATFKLAEAQALKITRRITGRVRLYQRVFELVGERATGEASKASPAPVEEADSNDTLRDNMHKWLADRQDNGEPLKFKEFVRFMVELGHDRKAALALKAEMTSAWKQMTAAR